MGMGVAMRVGAWARRRGWGRGLGEADGGVGAKTRTGVARTATQTGVVRVAARQYRRVR